MNSFYFIIWLTGAILSLYVIYKYVDICNSYKSIFERYKSEDIIKNFNLNFRYPKIANNCIFIFSLILFTFVIVAYITMSWWGAVSTYLIFKKS